MKEYVPIDITKRAKDAARAYERNYLSNKEEETESHAEAERLSGDGRTGREDAHFPGFNRKRCPSPDMALRKEDRLKMKAMGTNELSIARESVELRYLEQLKDQEQSMALAYLLKYAQLKMMDGRKDLSQIGDLLEEMLDRGGLESLFDRGDVSAQLARPRKQEIMACINRYRRLRIMG